MALKSVPGQSVVRVMEGGCWRVYTDQFICAVNELGSGKGPLFAGPKRARREETVWAV